MRLPAVRALALATLLVLTHVPASALLQRHAGDERRGTVSGHVVTSPLQLRDLELNFPVHKLGQIVLGAIIGSAIGVVVAQSSMGMSGANADVQDGVGHLWAGGVAGAMAVYTSDPEDDDLNRPMKARLALAEKRLTNGAMVGLVAGAMAQVFSGSSDEGGSSASSASSSSSSSGANTGGDGAEQNPGVQGLEEADRDARVNRALSALTMSGNFPVLHTAISGAFGAATCAYLEPEIMKFGNILGKDMAKAAKFAKSRATDLFEGYKQSNVCVSQKEFLEQRKSGKADGNKAVIAQCKEDTKIREVSLVHKDFEDRQDEKDKILEYYRKLCLGKEVCSVEPCTTRQCPAPGCHFDAKAPYKKRSIKYKCEGSPLKAKVCLSSKDAEQAKKERRLTKEGDIVVTKCAENEQVVEVMPDMPDDVNHENDEFSKQRQALETFCRRNEAHKFFVRCAFPVCGKDGECPTRDAFGCEFVPDEDRPGSPGSVTGDAHISYKCAPRKS